MRTIIATGLMLFLLAPMTSAQGQETTRGTRGTADDTDMEQNVGYRGWGPRAGFSLSPDQFVFGAHADFGHIARRVRLQPNVEVGIGDDVTLIAINLDAAFRFSERWEAWRPYLGLGPSFQIISVDVAEGVPDEVAEDDTETEFGIMAFGGIEKGLDNGNRLFIEAKLGLFDTPDAKFLVGYTFF